MTELLAVSLLLSLACFAATVALLAIPVSHRELRWWRSLRIGSLRRWISQKRHVNEPFHPRQTERIARSNLVWHLVLTGLFCTQLAWAVASEGSWWRPLTAPLVIFSIAYLAGSMVQRQKIAIARLRHQGGIPRG